MPGVLALGLERRDHHLDGGTIGILVALAVGLPVAWLTWALFRDSRRSGDRDHYVDPGDLADRLALVPRAQWEAEVALRRLNDPWPLQLSWGPADPAVSVSWDSLVRLATSGAGWPVPDASSWAAGPEQLRGRGRDLARVLEQIPTRRLVVLGEPGAGKTLLMVTLMLELLRRRAPCDPVPVLVSLASWNVEEQDLFGWLGARLSIDHPDLDAEVSATASAGSGTQALLAAGLLLPILDGLDEIPWAYRGTAVGRIAEALRPGQQMILTCRAEEYRSGPALRSAAAIELRPLEHEQVSEYLLHDGGLHARERWAPVLAALGTEQPLGRALQTPLMVGLARAAYNPPHERPSAPQPDPAELCDPRLAARRDVESHLFGAFLSSAYRRDVSRWTVRRVERSLAFLARHLEATESIDIAWWQLQRAIPVAVFGFTAVVILGLVRVVVSGVPSDLHNALAVGLGIGLASGLAALVMRSGLHLPANFRSRAWRRRAALFTACFILWDAGISAAVANGISHSIVGLPAEALLVLPVAAIGIGLAYRTKARPGREGTWRCVAEDIASGFAYGLYGGLGSLLVPGILLRLNGPWTGYSIEVVGGIGGIIIGIAILKPGGQLVSHITTRVSRWLRFAVMLIGLTSGLALIRSIYLFPSAWTDVIVEMAATFLCFILGLALAISRRHLGAPSRGLRWQASASSLGPAITIGAAGSFFALSYGFDAGWVVGLTAFTTFVAANALKGAPGDLAAESGSPNAVLARDRHAAIMSSLTGLITVGLPSGVLIGMLSAAEGMVFVPMGALTTGLRSALISGLAAGLAFGLIWGIMNAAWPLYIPTKAWLTLRYGLPWLLFVFLDDAHQRGVLRRVGPVYQFRHIELQHWLAQKRSPRSD